MICMKINCSNVATHGIRFYIFASTGKDPAVANVEVYCCELHATQEAADEVFINNEKGKEQIESSFKANNLAPPDWTRSYAEWIEHERFEA